jgi:hypothetical protein
MDQLLSWLSDYTLFLSVAAGASIALMLVSLAATPWFVASLPPDYLRPRAPDYRSKGLRRMLLQVFRNIVGLLFVILGLILLVTPGPGLVVLLVGVSLAEFPGKHRLLINIAIQPNVFSSLNWMRTRRGKPPFEYPDTKL